jgi:hypothetical protein
MELNILDLAHSSLEPNRHQDVSKKTSLSGFYEHAASANGRILNCLTLPDTENQVHGSEFARLVILFPLKSNK